VYSVAFAALIDDKNTNVKNVTFSDFIFRPISFLVTYVRANHLYLKIDASLHLRCEFQ
jgi:hypothetical protein